MTVKVKVQCEEENRQRDERCYFEMDAMEVDDVDQGQGQGSEGNDKGRSLPQSLPPHDCVLLQDSEQQNLIGSTFQHNVLSAPTLQPLFDVFLSSTANRSIDLSMLQILRTKPKEKFLSDYLFVRDCMRTIFGRFRNDTVTVDSNRVLLGSPVVGKSVLFFIAALFKALHGDMPVVYVRRTKGEYYISAFVMLRTATGDLAVYTCRNIMQDKFETTPKVVASVASCFGWGSLEDYLSFLDGPRHDDHKRLNACYHYFCTSGGHPLPKNEQKDLFLWILDGWSENEVIQLGKSRNKEELFVEAYERFGGCVRDMVEYVYSDDRSRSRSVATLKTLSKRIPGKNIDLVLTTTTRRNDDDSGNPDRLRMMFNGDSISEDIPDPVQVVDSQLVLRLLRGRQTIGSYLTALHQAKLIKSGTVVGVYFEETPHQWFKDSRPHGIQEVETATGTWAESTQKLNKKNMYWIPDTPNFPNIDAAAVLGRVLYAFQYTKKSVHGFNEDTFWQDFVSVVREKLDFDSVHVYITLIDKVTSTMKVAFTRQWKASSGTRQTSALVDITCTSSCVNVDTTSIETVKRTASAGFSFSFSQHDYKDGGEASERGFMTC